MNDQCFAAIRSERLEILLRICNATPDERSAMLYRDWPSYRDRLDNGDCDE